MTSSLGGTSQLTFSYMDVHAWLTPATCVLQVVGTFHEES